jgi:hypothetical protein
MLVKECGKLKIEFSQNDLLIQSGLSGLSFGSRQNTKCLVLDLSAYIFLLEGTSIIGWELITYHPKPL